MNYYQSRNATLNTRIRISCDLLLYGVIELGLVTNGKVYYAVNEFISSTDTLMSITFVHLVITLFNSLIA